VRILSVDCLARFRLTGNVNLSVAETNFCDCQNSVAISPWHPFLTRLRSLIRAINVESRTPAEAAGIKVEGDNKWLTLIQNAKRDINKSMS
jgi:hypothetical protein